MAEEYPKDNFGIPKKPYVIAEAYGGQKLRDLNSPENKALQDLLTPVEAAQRLDYWNKVDEMWSFYHDLVETAKDSLNDYNRLRLEFNLMQKEEDDKYKIASESIEEAVLALKPKRDAAIVKLEKAEMAYRPANAAFQIKKQEFQRKKAAIERIERAKTDLTLISSEGLTKTMKVMIWVVRVILGVALALSLGLIIGALNQYRPFTWQLIVFWFVGSAILFNSGTVIAWLAYKSAETAEAKRHPGAVVPPGNKWLWLLISTKLFFSASDAATLMFGAFRLLSVSGTHIPLPILFIVCFIFVFPYLYMETRCGWKEGERKVRDHILDVLEGDEKDVKGLALDPSIEEEAKIEGLKATCDQARAELAEIDAEIVRLRGGLKKTYLQPPVDYAVGVYEKEDGQTHPVRLAEFIEPPFNESITIALRRFWKAVEEAEDFDTEIKKTVLARERAPKTQPRGFFARWRPIQETA
jgi:hypothetical protein